MNIQEMYEEARTIAPWISDARRALHRIPEPGFSEWKTQAYLCGKLDELGVPYATERTWIIATIQGAHAGPTVALRADIDALPVNEPEGCPFRSEHEGWMHACGHDAHAAIQLGAAKLLMRHRDALHGNVRLLFQPAEETDGGAKPMTEAGAMDGVSRVFGLHVQPYMNVGNIDTRYGTLNAATNEVNIVVRGRSGHAARPDACVDAIVCAAQIVTVLQTAISRSLSPLKPGVLSLGMIQGGSAKNIICDEVRFGGTLRTVDPESRALMKRRIREISEGVAQAFGAQAEVAFGDGYSALINHDAEVDRVLRLGKALLGEAHANLRREPSMGGEDFSFFVERAPGAFYHLGCSAGQPAAALHSRGFSLDERCLPIGAAMQTALAMDALNECKEG